MVLPIRKRMMDRQDFIFIPRDSFKLQTEYHLRLLIDLHFLWLRGN